MRQSLHTHSAIWANLQALSYYFNVSSMRLDKMRHNPFKLIFFLLHPSVGIFPAYIPVLYLAVI